MRNRLLIIASIETTNKSAITIKSPSFSIFLRYDLSGIFFYSFPHKQLA